MDSYSNRTDYTLPTNLHDDLSYNIHNFFTSNQIEQLHKIFLDNHNSISYNNLRKILIEFNVILTDSQYKLFFLKLSDKKNDTIDWEEFISYLILRFQEKCSTDVPIILPISNEPIVKDSQHRTSIISIVIIQSLTEQIKEEQFGYYVTASKDGGIKFWSPSLKLSKSGLSKSHYLKISTTWVVCIVALSDVQIICVSSTERELRFYDVQVTKFNLRAVIRYVPYVVGTMSYAFSKQDDHKSKLLLGDINGNVKILEFSPKLGGPFKSSNNSTIIELTWNQVLKGNFGEARVIEYLNIFSTNITQVFYSYKLDTIYVSSASNKYLDKTGLIAIDSRGIKNMFNIPQGVTTFCLDELNLLLATGGPDTCVRIWDPYVTWKVSSVLDGHRAGIIFIFIQPENKRIYTIDSLKILKVWDDYNLMQTYSDLCIYEPELCFCYNHIAHELLIGGKKLVSLKCSYKHGKNVTDGETHSGPVSIVLFNDLFENIVTCGLDSIIMIWDTWSGKRHVIIKNCHTMDLLGQTINLEITAAVFDPSFHYLITGARDGSLKIWNYNNAVCTRNLRIDSMCEVTDIFWLPERILVVGWNRCVTEFADAKGYEYSNSKKWVYAHDSDITAAACIHGNVFVSGSYTGEICFWNTDSGQPYRKHLVNNPLMFCDLRIDTINKKPMTKSSPKSVHYSNRSLLKKSSIAKIAVQTNTILPEAVVNKPQNFDLNKIRNSKLGTNICISIQAIIILKTRSVTKNHGNVLVALNNGWIQIYSHSYNGGFLTEFLSTHKIGDYVVSMTTDKENKYLLTGTALGYIKIWLLQNYCVPISEHTKISKPLLRLKFFFMSNDRINCRVKRLLKDNYPLLLNSYKGHMQSITSIVYLDKLQVVITGSHDKSVRMWTIGGRYLGTIGGLVPTKELFPNKIIDESTEKFRVPPDIYKVGSSTTMKVLTGQVIDRLKDQFELNQNFSKYDNSAELRKYNINKMGKRTKFVKINEPILGKHFKLNNSMIDPKIPILNKSIPYISVYSHLNIHNTNICNISKTPDDNSSEKSIKNLDFMNYYSKYINF